MFSGRDNIFDASDWVFLQEIVNVFNCFCGWPGRGGLISGEFSQVEGVLGRDWPWPPHLAPVRPSLFCWPASGL